MENKGDKNTVEHQENPQAGTLVASALPQAMEEVRLLFSNLSRPEALEVRRYLQEFEAAIRQSCPNDVIEFHLPNDVEQSLARYNGPDETARIILNGEEATVGIRVVTFPGRKPTCRYTLDWGWRSGGHRAFHNTNMSPTEAIPKLLDYRHSYAGITIITTAFPGEGPYWDWLRARKASNTVNASTGGEKNT